MRYPNLHKSPQSARKLSNPRVGRPRIKKIPKPGKCHGPVRVYLVEKTEEEHCPQRNVALIVDFIQN